MMKDKQLLMTPPPLLLLDRLASVSAGVHISPIYVNPFTAGISRAFQFSFIALNATSNILYMYTGEVYIGLGYTH